MRRLRFHYGRTVCVIVATLAAMGCAAEREAKFADPSLMDVGTDQLVLMPVIDQRDDRFDQFDIGRHVRSAAGKVLERVFVARVVNGTQQVLLDDLQRAGIDARCGAPGDYALVWLGDRPWGKQMEEDGMTTAEIRALARKSTPEALKQLSLLAEMSSCDKARREAVKELVTRGYERVTKSTDKLLSISWRLKK